MFQGHLKASSFLKPEEDFLVLHLAGYRCGAQEALQGLAANIKVTFNLVAHPSPTSQIHPDVTPVSGVNDLFLFQVNKVQ